MNEEYLSNSCSSECFFEYKIEQLPGGGDIQPPKIYLERHYGDASLPYVLFAVPQEWLEKDNYARNNSLPYDRIGIVFDVAGLDCQVLTNEDSEDYRKAEIHDPVEGRSIEAFYKSGCRIPITDTNRSRSLAGVGVISMYKEKKLVARFFLTVNFTFKRKIYYDVSYSGSKLNIDFECESDPVGIDVRVVWNENRLPCLKNDMGNIVDEFTLEFKGGRARYSKPIGGATYGQDVKFSVTIIDEDASNYYLLHCRKNDTVKIQNPKVKYHPVVYICPYCHTPMDNRIDGNMRYKRGGISCGYYSKHGTLPTILDKKGKKAKNCIFCSADVSDTGDFDFNFMRLFPANYMSHDSFKIAFLGSKRAGKTTFISRFFHLCGSEGAQMDMEMVANGVSKMGVRVRPAQIMRLNNSGDHRYSVDDEAWINKETYYNDRVINLDQPRYPKPTTTDVGSYGRYPFVAEVNESSYVAFYDVAGEDSQNRQMVTTIAGGEGEYVGVFCIVSGSKDSYGNSAVFNQLKASRIHKDSPIAVIVTKFDTLGSHFDPNCHCIRTDYYEDEENIYTGSFLQREIDYSSEEICSYLKSEGLYQDLSAEFKNVKFFGISSFNFKESIHSDKENLEDPGKVKFECSSNRLELPFIWMLNQFGIIK